MRHRFHQGGTHTSLTSQNITRSLSFEHFRFSSLGFALSLNEYLLFWGNTKLSSSSAFKMRLKSRKLSLTSRTHYFILVDLACSIFKLDVWNVFQKHWSSFYTLRQISKRFGTFSEKSTVDRSSFVHNFWMSLAVTSELVNLDSL